MELACNLAGVMVSLALAIYLAIKGRGCQFGLRKWVTIACLMAIVWWVITIDDDLANTAAMVESVRTTGGIDSKATSQPDLIAVLVRFALNSCCQGDNSPDWLLFPALARKLATSQGNPDLDNRPPPGPLCA
jgi:hypothetical protein